LEQSPNPKQSNDELKTVSAVEKEATPDELRRSFLKRFGGYSVALPAVAFTVLSTVSSKAVASSHPDDGGG
jgi:hypothetical protein